MEHQDSNSNNNDEQVATIVFPEDSGSRPFAMPDTSERILDVDPDAPDIGGRNQATASTTTASSTNEDPRMVLPTEDTDAKKKKPAHINYFTNSNRQTREQRERIKSGKGMDDSSKSSKQLDDSTKSKSDPAAAGGGDNHLVTQRKSYLEAMTPQGNTADEHLKKQEKEQQPSYLSAIDSEKFEVDEEKGQAAPVQEQQTPIGAFSVTGSQATARSKTMLEAMTPSGNQMQQQQDLQAKKMARPSYLTALDEESGPFHQNDENDPQGNLNDDPQGDPQGSQFPRGARDPLVDGIQAMPAPPVPVAPGAHSLGKRGGGVRGSIVIGDGDNNDVPMDAAELEKLAVALMVNEDDDDNISVATPASLRSKTDVEGETKLFLQRMAGAAVVVVAAFLLGLGLALGLNLGGKEYDEEPTMAPTTIVVATTTDAPTPAEVPISSKASALLARILPDHTMATIEEFESSPQAKAYDWITEDLLEDPSKLSLPIERIQQRFALATLYYSTGGDEWSENDRWLNHSLHECLWYSKPWWSWDFTGVPPEGFTSNDNPNACEWSSLNPTDLYPGHQYYRHLWQYENNLKGTLPPQLGLLTQLVSLYVFNNSGLVGPLPSQLGQLERLRAFNVGTNQFTGTLPSELGAMISLKEISIFDTKIRGTIPPELGKMTLATLNLDNNLLTGDTIPSTILGMTTLRHLILSNNDLSGPVPTQLGQLSKLSCLKMSGSRFSGSIPSEIGTLTRLYNLWLHGNRLSGSLPTQLGNLVKTPDFKFGHNRLAGSLPTQLGLCTGVVRFEAQSNNLVGTIPTQLGQWPSLSFLYLQDNFFTGTIPEEMPQLTQITPHWWSVGNGWIPDLLVQWRQELLPLRHLTIALQDNRLSGTIPANFSIMQNLSSVQLTNNPLLSGTVPDNLCSLPSLPLFGKEATFDCTNLLCGCDCNCSDSAL